MGLSRYLMQWVFVRKYLEMRGILAAQPHFRLEDLAYPKGPRTGPAEGDHSSSLASLRS